MIAVVVEAAVEVDSAINMVEAVEEVVEEWVTENLEKVIGPVMGKFCSSEKSIYFYS